MTNKQKENLMNFLFPNEEIRQFLCNDFFQEIKEKIPVDFCISKTNMSDIERIKKHALICVQIEEFINKKPIYRQRICELFKIGESYLYTLQKDLMTGYIFYLIETTDKFKNIDMFKDKRSVCYDKISVVDMFDF